MNGIRLGLLMSLVCKVSWRGMSAARRICLLTKLRLKDVLYEVRCLKSNEDTILALTGQFKQF